MTCILYGRALAQKRLFRQLRERERERERARARERERETVRYNIPKI